MNNSRANLREAKLTDKSIDIRTYNGMVDFASMKTQPGSIGEIVDQFGSAAHEGIPFQRQLWWPCISDDDVVPFSIVEVYAASPAGVDFFFRVRKVTANARMYAGNDQYVLTAGGDRDTPNCWIKLVTPYEPVTVVTSDPSVTFLTEVKPDGNDGVEGTTSSGKFIALTQPESETTRIGVILKTTSGGVGSCNTIRFYVSAPAPGLMACICIVQAVPAGFTLADVPGMNGDDPYGFPAGTVTVHDPQCAFFNEPEDDLIGRLGWAHYMQPLIPTTDQPSEYDLVPEWEVFSLACFGNTDCEVF